MLSSRVSNADRCSHSRSAPGTTFWSMSVRLLKVERAFALAPPSTFFEWKPRPPNAIFMVISLFTVDHQQPLLARYVDVERSTCRI